MYVCEVRLQGGVTLRILAGWASLLGQQGLIRAQEIKMEAIRKAPKPAPGQQTIQLGQEVAQQMHVCRMDALVFLLMSNQFFESALNGKPETLGKMEEATAYRLYNLARVALGFAFRHTCVAALPQCCTVLAQPPRPNVLPLPCCICCAILAHHLHLQAGQQQPKDEVLDCGRER